MTVRVFLPRLLATAFVIAGGNLMAQEPEPVAPEPEPAPEKANAVLSTAPRVVNLQTTVTGNQEQPRVLYILPWQSPPASEIDFELLDGQETSVFSHLERTEFRRQLEAAGEFD